MAEIPEHLLERTRARRAALGLPGGEAPAGGDAAGGGDGGSGGAATPAVAAAAGKVPTADFSTPAKPRPEAKPPAPHVQRALDRRQIPVWAMPVLVMLPVWAVLYVGTLSPADLGGQTALQAGAEVYGTNCSTCHGAGGGGGAGPALADGAVLSTFPDPAEQYEWVRLGSEGWLGEYGPTRGANDTPVIGGMGGFESLGAAELLFVVRHERENLSGEEFDPEAWAPLVEELVANGDLEAELAEKFLADEQVVAGQAGGH